MSLAVRNKDAGLVRQQFEEQRVYMKVLDGEIVTATGDEETETWPDDEGNSMGCCAVDGYQSMAGK